MGSPTHQSVAVRRRGGTLPPCHYVRPDPFESRNQSLVRYSCKSSILAAAHPKSLSSRVGGAALESHWAILPMEWLDTRARVRYLQSMLPFLEDW